MAMFTSSRERLFWLLAILCQLLIYSTLNIQPALARIIRESGLIDDLFITGFGILVFAVALIGFVRKMPWLKIVLAIGVISILFFAMSRLGQAEERSHLFEYSFIGALVYLALVERKTNASSIRHPVILATAIVAFTGIIDEIIQYLLPNRVFDFRDIGFNLMASTGTILLIFFARKLFYKRKLAGN